ncbi:hypothetical protein CRV24_009781 [Beauveria bassiana]|nr:hypothetical protein CRV24_009781 [Beauveria bassiana]KAH8708077.1 hypothetical protein HC256_010224 [Beauveria bassiana]
MASRDRLGSAMAYEEFHATSSGCVVQVGSLVINSRMPLINPSKSISKMTEEGGGIFSTAGLRDMAGLQV